MYLTNVANAIIKIKRKLLQKSLKKKCIILLIKYFTIHISSLIQITLPNRI